MATEIPPINSADVVRVVRVALVAPDDPVELVVRAALVVPDDPVGLVGQAALVVPDDPVGLVGQAALVVPESLVVPEDPAVQVALVASESPGVQVERELVQVEVGPVQGRRLAQLAVALRTKSVIAAHHRDQVPLLAVEADLAAAVAETTREPAVAEAVIAWAAADTVAVVAEAAAVTEPAAVVEDAAVEVTVAEDAAVAAEDAEDKGGLNDEETNENKNKYYDFAEDFFGRLCGPYFLFVNDHSARCAIGQNGCTCDIAAKPKRIRLTKAGSRGSYSGSDDLRCRRRKGNSGAGQRRPHCFTGPRSRQESGGRVCSQGKGKELG
jgi:hypothetical protein